MLHLLNMFPGFQGLGGLFVRSIEGDYNTVVGFPLQSFFALLHELAESGELDS